MYIVKEKSFGLASVRLLGIVFTNLYLPNDYGFTLETLRLWCALLLLKVLMWVVLLRSIPILKKLLICITCSNLEHYVWQNLE